MKITQLGLALLAGITAAGCNTSNPEISNLPAPIPNKTPVVWSTQPFTGIRVPQTAYLDLGSYSVVGLRVQRSRGKNGFYMRAELGGGEDRIDGPGGSYADISENKQDYSLGYSRDFVNNKKSKIRFDLGVKVSLSEMEGVVNEMGFETEIQGKSEAHKAEAALEASLKLGKRGRLAVEVCVEKDFLDEEGIPDYETSFMGSIGVEF